MISVLLRTLLWSALLVIPSANAEDAAELIKKAIDYWRGTSSYGVMDMTIHRPDWQRSMTIRVWTRGENESLVRVAAPPKDVGNATLLVKDDMWSFNPKINRVVKIPSSMMNQSWMGSDFTNNDLAKADDIVEQYTHKLLRTEAHEGHKLYVVESVPKETAPVVWGREIVKVRDDWLIIEHAFYDQSDVLVKRLVAQEIKSMGGKLVVARERMQRLDKPGEWTEVNTRQIEFGIDIPPNTFTLTNLRNPRN